MKLKKLLATLTAAVMAVTVMAFAPISVSAATTLDPAPVGQETVLADMYNGQVPLSNVRLTADPNAAWGAGTSVYPTCYESGMKDWVRDSEVYIKISLTNLGTFNGNDFDTLLTWDLAGWFTMCKVGGNDTSYYPAAGATQNLAVVYVPITDLNLTVDSGGGTGFNIHSGHIDINVASVQIVRIIEKDPVPPEADVSLGTLTGGGEQTIEVASWDPNAVDKNTWSSNFYSAVADAAKAAYYLDTDEYLHKFAGILYEVKVSSASTLKYGSIQAQPMAVSSSAWISGSNNVFIEDGANKFYTYMDMSELPAGTTYSNIGVQLYDSQNFNTVGQTGSISYTVKATLLIKAPSLSIDETLTIYEGEEDTVTAAVSPEAISSSVKWSSDNEAVASVDENGKVTAVSPGTAVITAVSDVISGLSDTCIVTVKLGAQPITVKANNSTFGTASADKSEAVEGTEVKLTAEAAEGYQFEKWVAVSGDVTFADSKDASTTFTMPASEVEIEAVFSEIPAGFYGITVKIAEGGSAKASEKSAIAGTKITLSAAPDEGYEFDKWIISPETAVIVNNEFTMPEEAVTITPVFRKRSYSIEVKATAGGRAEADKTTAQMGETVTITAVPDTDYCLAGITVNGTAISGTSFEMPAENVTVIAEFKEKGSADAEIKAPAGVNVSFTDSSEKILAAVFGDDYASLVEAGNKLEVVMTVKDEKDVVYKDRALINAVLKDGQNVGLLLDISLIKTVNGVSESVKEIKYPVSFSISVPDSIIADGRTYSVLRVHDNSVQNIGGSFDSKAKTITVSSNHFSTYAIVYTDKADTDTDTDGEGIETKPQPVKYYSITAGKNVSVSAGSAAAGTDVNVKPDFGYDAYVYCGTQVIAKITGNGSFKMPSGNVTIVTKENGYLAMIKNAAPNSYIFVYDPDMNSIKTSGSVKGIKGEGEITVKLGEEYAGKTITLYKGRKSTKISLGSKTLDKNGNAVFVVEGGKNYTAVVE